MNTKLLYFQWDYEDEVRVKLISDDELIQLIDQMDFTGIHVVKIFDVTDFNNIFEIRYVGWQPNCLIEFADNKGNIVLSGYGVDH